MVLNLDCVLDAKIPLGFEVSGWGRWLDVVYCKGGWPTRKAGRSRLADLIVL